MSKFKSEEEKVFINALVNIIMPKNIDEEYRRRNVINNLACDYLIQSQAILIRVRICIRKILPMPGNH